MASLKFKLHLRYNIRYCASVATLHAEISCRANQTMASNESQVHEALALIQKTSAAGGGSLHDSLVKLIVKVRPCSARHSSTAPPKQHSRLM